MGESMSVEVSTSAVDPAVEPKKAKSKAKKVKAKTPAKKSSEDGRDRSMAPVPASERRKAFLALLRRRKADKPSSAIAISEMAEKLGYNSYDVYCLGYHKYPLAAGGYVKSVKHEGDKELSFYATAKGMKSSPDDE